MREINRDPDSASFLTLDCSILNFQISRDEVRMSVYMAQARKAPVAYELSSEVIRNDSCIDIFLGSTNIDLIMVRYQMNGQRV